MNPHIQDMEEDVLYHLALGSGSHDLQQMFGDVKYVCMGGTPQRMKSFAEYMLSQLGYLLPTGTCLVDYSERSSRYQTQIQICCYHYILPQPKLNSNLY